MTIRKANVTLWMIAIRHKLTETSDPARRDYLARLYIELAQRLDQ